MDWYLSFVLTYLVIYHPKRNFLIQLWKYEIVKYLLHLAQLSALIDKFNSTLDAVLHKFLNFKQLLWDDDKIIHMENFVCVCIVTLICHERLLERHAGVPIRPLNNKQDQQETRNLHFLKGLEIFIWNLMNTNWTFISLQGKIYFNQRRNVKKKRN